MQQAELELLLIDAQNGDQQAFEKLYRAFNPALTRYARRLCLDVSMAEEASQDAWLSFAKNLRRIRDPRTFRSWLYQKVRWRISDLSRNLASKVTHEPLEENLNYFDTEEIGGRNDLRVAIDKLPPLERHMIYLFYLDELKLNEIATVLGIPVGTVKSRLNRARNLLAGKIESQQ